MMAPPLPLAFWEAIRRQAEPFELMRFTLTYDGDLPSGGNRPKQAEVARIRNVFHDQLADLWDSHIVLRELERTARVPYIIDHGEIRMDWTDFKFPSYTEAIPPLPKGYLDLCAPIKKGTSVAYRPIVRESLGLACALDIAFLRQEDPGSLVLQGGDIDGRMKVLFDALRVPSEDEERASGVSPTADPLQCLLESDALISELSIKTGRLLGDRTKKVHAVRLMIEVTIKVLRVSYQNQCLMGD